MDRRSVLNAGLHSLAIVSVAAIPVAAQATVPPHDRRSAAWDVAMAEFVAAKQAMDTQEGEEVVGRFIKAEAAILDTRTPDMKALHWKLERMRDISEDNVIEPKDFEKLLADVGRLLEDA